ncbi:hypothetical protein P7C73_g3518, partial [Tremellales sp. Uapishka_1]
MATTTTASAGPVRRPTLSVPTLHLGSFHSLSMDAYPPSPTKSSTSPISPVPGTMPSWEATGVPGPSRSPAVALDLDPSKQKHSGGGVAGAGGRASSPRRAVSSSKASIPPPLPPPSSALPPLPLLSPISPLRAPSPSHLLTSSPSVAGLPDDHPPAMIATAPPLQAFPVGSRLPPVSPRVRPGGPSLTILTASPMTPASSNDARSPGPTLSPIELQQSSIPRRRTIIVPSSSPSGAKVAEMEDSSAPFSFPIPQPQFTKTDSVGQDTLPIPNKGFSKPAPSGDTGAATATEGPSNSQNRITTNGSVGVSPTSPTTKRSLPRPPSQKSQQDALARPSAPDLRNPPIDSQPSRLPLPQQQAPLPSASYPPPSRPLQPLPHSRNRQSSTMPAPMFYQKHQASNSASNLAIIPGLQDSGPYPSSPAQNAGINKPTPIGMGTPSRPPKGLQQQEEVCLECMMRDRDLADVDVYGEGVWERSSDIAWEDMKERENALRRSIRGGSMSSGSLADSSGSESETTTISYSSTGNTRHGNEMRKRQAARKQQKELSRARKREGDSRIAQEVGWRGFVWEEGAGEGLPRGFRGNKGGRLTEQAIKAVMTKFPSASAHRYGWLQTYLHNQYLVILELRAEVLRIGRYPDPTEAPEAPSTLSSHEDRPRTSGSSAQWDARHARELSEHMRGAFVSSSPPVLQPIRPSPSTPTMLGAQANGRGQVKLPARPQTHFYPDREPVSNPRMPISGPPTTRARHGKGISSPSILERTYPQDDVEWDDALSPGESGLRPFSFAVRAGAQAGQESSDGHGRRSIWGKFGGSVTSLFGGSQGGSGSMMDMHVGLESDRLNRAASNVPQAHPRSVSLASPSRPSFFSRDSRAESINGDSARRPSKSGSGSRLSQMVPVDDDDDNDIVKKKRGIKGLLQKMKPRKASARSDKQSSMPKEDDVAELAPPPPISYLVGRGDRHARKRSESASSAMTDNSVSVLQPSFGLRSVSAPLAGSSSGGSPSVSPTSSRFATANAGARRESMASIQNGRRRSDLMDGLGSGSGMEMLIGGRRFHSSPEPSEDVRYQHQQQQHQHQLQQHQLPTSSYPPLSFKPHNRTALSLSNSSGTMLETPPPSTYASNGFFNPPSQVHQQPQQKQQSPTSPNRFKNLPPLPPSDYDTTELYESRKSMFDRNQSQLRYPQPIRTSLEPPTPRRRQGEISPRLAQSMYVQPTAADSTGSFSRYASRRSSGGQDLQVGINGGSEKKNLKSRGGLKGLFGVGNKAGRLA